MMTFSNNTLSTKFSLPVRETSPRAEPTPLKRLRWSGALQRRRAVGVRVETSPTFRRPRLFPTILQTVFILLMVVTSGCTDIKKWAYEGFNRDEWQKPEEVIKALKIQPGDQVADLGSGSGYFTFRLADAVGPTGKVYAADVDADMNADLERRVKEKGYKNIEVLLAKTDDPGLPERRINLIFSSNVYHHLENRPTYFANVKQYLAPQGRIAIIDFHGEGWLQKLIGHYTPSETIRRELQEAGYTLDQELDFLPDQVFLIFSLNRP